MDGADITGWSISDIFISIHTCFPWLCRSCCYRIRCEQHRGGQRLAKILVVVAPYISLQTSNKLSSQRKNLIAEKIEDITHFLLRKNIKLIVVNIRKSCGY